MNSQRSSACPLLPRTTPARGASPLLPGELFGRFHLRGLLGAGTTALVFEADMGQQPVALKILWPAFWHDARQATRLLREAEIGRSLRHPGLVRVLDAGVVPSCGAYLVMERLQGEGLGARLRRHARQGGALPGAGSLITQLALALGEAHAQGVVHRDLKPDNVLLISDGEAPGGERAKLLDFGLASAAGVRLSGADGALGTPAYMAPELCRPGALVEPSADVYSLGVLAYELLTGDRLCDAEEHGPVLARHRAGAPRPLRAALPRQLEALVGRMLAREPGQRPTMAEVAAHLGPGGAGPYGASLIDHPAGSGTPRS